VTNSDGDTADTRCKAIAVMAGGASRSATYLDSLRRDGGRRRMGYRKALVRRTPLNRKWR